MARFYSTQQWNNLRDMYRGQNPMCERCAKMGVTKLAQMVDHITPIKQGGGKMDWDNLQSLCFKCHNQKTGSERRGKRKVKQELYYE